MSVRNKILRYWTYFRRGHGTYLAFLLSFANFMVIQYRLLIEHMPLLRDVFFSLIAFAVTFLLVYVPVATILGWLDYKRLAVPIDLTISAKSSPWVQDLAKALMLICDEKYEDAKKTLQKWIEE